MYDFVSIIKYNIVHIYRNATYNYTGPTVTLEPLNRRAPNLEPRPAVNQELEALEIEAMRRSTINQELEALEIEAMSNEPPGSQRRTSSSSTDSDHSDHSHEHDQNNPPDYQHALQYRDTKPSEKEDLVAKPPPSYDTVA